MSKFAHMKLTVYYLVNVEVWRLCNILQLSQTFLLIKNVTTCRVYHKKENPPALPTEGLLVIFSRKSAIKQKSASAFGLIFLLLVSRVQQSVNCYIPLRDDR